MRCHMPCSETVWWICFDPDLIWTNLINPFNIVLELSNKTKQLLNESCAEIVFSSAVSTIVSKFAIKLCKNLNILAMQYSVKQKILHTVLHFFHVSGLRRLPCAEFFGFFYSQEFTIRYDFLWNQFFFHVFQSCKSSGVCRVGSDGVS